jgi:hypothetical protein
MDHPAARKFNTWINSMILQNTDPQKAQLMEGTIKVKMRLMLLAVLKDGGNAQTSVEQKAKPTSKYRDTGKTRGKRVHPDKKLSA